MLLDKHDARSNRLHETSRPPTHGLPKSTTQERKLRIVLLRRQRLQRCTDDCGDGVLHHDLHLLAHLLAPVRNVEVFSPNVCPLPFGRDDLKLRIVTGGRPRAGGIDAVRSTVLVAHNRVGLPHGHRRVELAAALNSALKRKPRDTSQLKLDVFVRAVMSCLKCPPAMALREREYDETSRTKRQSDRHMEEERERER